MNLKKYLFIAIVCLQSLSLYARDYNSSYFE